MADNPGISPTPQPSGRGKTLTMEEERSLVHIVQEAFGHYDVTDYPKKYWIDISHSLYNETGRSYSWQSCQRRVIRMIQACKDFSDNGRIIELLERDMQREIQTMSTEARRDIDAWIQDCDEYPKFWSELAGTKKEEMEFKVESAKQELEDEEERKKRELEAELDAARKGKQDRVRKWLDCLPPMDKMQPGASWKTERPNLHEFFPSQKRTRPSQQRGRSRSPRREGNNYRQRTRSPHSRPPAQAAASAHPVKKLLDEVLGDDSEGTDSLEKDMPPEDLANWKRMRQSFPDAAKEQLKAAQRLAKTIDNAAMDFSVEHMQPLIMSLGATDLSSKLQTLDMVDSACVHMFRSISGITMEFFHAMAEQQKQV